MPYARCCAAAGSSPSDLRTELLELFSHWSDPVSSLIQATSSREVLRNDLYDRPPVRGWGSAAVTLLGDAAHPMSPAAGQGACLALEDAVVLGTCVLRAPGPVAALRTYEAERIGRAARMQRASLAALRTLQPRARPLEVVRDLVLRLPPDWLAGRQAWMFDFRPSDWPRHRPTRRLV